MRLTLEPRPRLRARNPPAHASQPPARVALKPRSLYRFSLPASLSLPVLLVLLALAPPACLANDQDYYDFRGTLPGGIGAPAATAAAAAATIEPADATASVGADATTQVTAFQQAMSAWQQQQDSASAAAAGAAAAAATNWRSKFVRVDGVHFMAGLGGRGQTRVTGDGREGHPRRSRS
jgi:hypothetical protein